jgi:hypothetical protein
MKLSTPLLALALLPFIAPLPAPAQDKDKSDKAADKAVEKADKAAEKSTLPAEAKELHTYRLAYTLIEMEAGKKVGEQHYTMMVNAGSKYGMIRIGSKVPIKTGSFDSAALKQETTQFQYMDVGLSINATLSVVPNGIQVSSQVDQSAIADSASPAQPVIRQTTLTSNATLIPGGHVQLGSLDIPGSTHHLEVELTLERVN